MAPDIILFTTLYTSVKYAGAVLIIIKQKSIIAIDVLDILVLLKVARTLI